MQVNSILYMSLSHMPTIKPECAKKILTLICQRQQVGEEKYGHTIDRTDIDEAQWRMHLLEELLDGVQYAARCGNDCETRIMLRLLEAIARLIEYMEQNKEI